MEKAREDLRRITALSLVKNMGPVGFKRLTEKLGGVDAVLGASRAQFDKAKKGVKAIWEDLKSPGLLARADAEIEKAHKLGVDMIPLYDERYPSLLKEIHDPPILLYVKGALPPQDRLKVAVVGSRVSSIYGSRMALQIAKDLGAAGAVVVSGLALGIDTAAHEGALAGGGLTVAVLGGGIGKLYPPGNKKLAEKICAGGALVSEYPVDMAPSPSYFPVRNRIISGMSEAVLVVEAKEKSGALITADSALEQGREVFALPGNADSAKSLGTNSLLKQGARLALSAADILAELGYTSVKKSKEARRAAITAEEEKLVSILESGPLHLDEIVEATGFSLSKALGMLSALEMKMHVKEAPGKYFQKV